MTHGRWEDLGAVDADALRQLQEWLLGATFPPGPRGPLGRFAMITAADALPPEDVVREAVKPAIQSVDTKTKIYVGRVMASRVVPGLVHETHVDEQLADWRGRIHVPLETNHRSRMTFGDPPNEEVVFRVGRLYALCTRQPHAFFNLGETYRTHLLVDLYEECEHCECWHAEYEELAAPCCYCGPNDLVNVICLLDR